MPPRKKMKAAAAPEADLAGWKDVERPPADAPAPAAATGGKAPPAGAALKQDHGAKAPSKPAKPVAPAKMVIPQWNAVELAVSDATACALM